jgi:hypothetical protein
MGHTEECKKLSGKIWREGPLVRYKSVCQDNAACLFNSYDSSPQSGLGALHSDRCALLGPVGLDVLTSACYS